MEVVIAGGHGQIALRLARLLAGRGDSVRSLIRNPAHADDVSAAGAEPVVFDLEAPEGDLAAVVRGADAVVFAAGAGPGSGAARKRTVDLGAAVRLIDAAREAGVRRYVMISSIGADDPAGGGETMRPYLEAKARGGRGAGGERPRRHDRAPGPADERPGHRDGQRRGGRRPGGDHARRRRGGRRRRARRPGDDRQDVRGRRRRHADRNGAVTALSRLRAGWRPAAPVRRRPLVHLLRAVGAACREPPADRAGRAAPRARADRADGRDRGGEDRARARPGPAARRPARARESCGRARPRPGSRGSSSCPTSCARRSATGCRPTRRSSSSRGASARRGGPARTSRAVRPRSPTCATSGASSSPSTASTSTAS